MRDQDKFRGCLIGGAAGDALGYAVEFLPEELIFRRYGENGITAYELIRGQAEFSDDTQMTLFTAAGLLSSAAHRVRGGYAAHINAAYLDWLETQERSFSTPKGYSGSWLMDVPGLYQRRAPGNTCLSALLAGGGGTPEQPINGSKGCGGVMRTAPVGLYFNGTGTPAARVALLGAEAAALTHGHPLGWIPGAALAQIIHEVAQDGAALEDAVRHSLDTVDELWPDTEDRHYFRTLMERALSMAGEDMDDLEGIHDLGQGWVGEEALAIAVYCAAKYPTDFDRVLIAAVNHSGDSDSTGAIAGNIAGAMVGLQGIPGKYLADLELRDVILQVADDLWGDHRLRNP